MRRRLSKFFLTATAIAAIAIVWGVSQKSKAQNGLLLANIEALASGETVTYEGYMETGGICTKCNKDVDLCIWCTEDGNNCSCTITLHSC